MKKQIFKISLFVVVAFLGGMLTHAKIYANSPAASSSLISTSVPQKNYRVRQGRASWYSRKSPGIRKHTANMEVFDDTQLTAAMWGVPFNSRVRVTNLDNGKSVIVRVNDRGPHKRFVRKGRIIDLTRSAFNQIGGLSEGLISVEIEFL